MKKVEKHIKELKLCKPSILGFLNKAENESKLNLNYVRFYLSSDGAYFRVALFSREYDT